MMPLFVIEDDLNIDLMKLDNGMIGIGYWAVDECDYTNQV